MPARRRQSTAARSNRDLINQVGSGMGSLNEKLTNTKGKAGKKAKGKAASVPKPRKKTNYVKPPTVKGPTGSVKVTQKTVAGRSKEKQRAYEEKSQRERQARRRRYNGGKGVGVRKTKKSS